MRYALLAICSTLFLAFTASADEPIRTVAKGATLLVPVTLDDDALYVTQDTDAFTSVKLSGPNTRNMVATVTGTAPGKVTVIIVTKSYLAVFDVTVTDAAPEPPPTPTVTLPTSPTKKIPVPAAKPSLPKVATPPAKPVARNVRSAVPFVPSPSPAYPLLTMDRRPTTVSLIGAGQRRTTAPTAESSNGLSSPSSLVAKPTYTSAPTATAGGITKEVAEGSTCTT